MDEADEKEESQPSDITANPEASKDMFSESDGEDLVKEKSKKDDEKIVNKEKEERITESHTSDVDESHEPMNTSPAPDKEEEDIDSEEANARARDAVLQSTSSESDQAKDPESEE